MTDLNPALTDFDKSLIIETPKLPDLKPFSVWSGENQLDESDAKSYVQYSDYLREGYLNNGLISPQDDYDIAEALNSKLSDFGIVDEEDIAAITAPKEISFEEKLGYVFASMDGSDLDWQTISEYKAGSGVVTAGGTTEGYQAKIAVLKERVEGIVSKRYNDVKRSLVESDQIPMAYVINEEGKRELLAGDAAENMSVAQAIKASKLGGVSFKDALAAQHLLTPMEGLNINVAKFKKIMEISMSIAELAGKDSSVSEHIEGHIKQISRQDSRVNNSDASNLLDSTFSAFGRYVSDISTALGVEKEENNEKRKRIHYASNTSFLRIINHITDKLNASGANYRLEDVRDAYEETIVRQAAGSNSFEFDQEDAGRNLYKTALGPVMHNAVYTREKDLTATLAAHPEIPNNVKNALIIDGERQLRGNFATLSDKLSRGPYGEEWVKTLVASRQAGRDDLATYKDFIESDEHYSQGWESTTGVLHSIWEGGASMLLLAPTIAGFDWGKQGLGSIAKRQSDRRELAHMVFYETWASLPPLSFLILLPRPCCLPLPQA